MQSASERNEKLRIIKHKEQVFQLMKWDLIRQKRSVLEGKLSEIKNGIKRHTDWAKMARIYATFKAIRNSFYSELKHCKD